MADETVVAGTFASRYEAEFARETLHAAGIDTILLADDAGGAYAGLSLTGPARLLVLSSDVVRAKVLLDEAASIPDPERQEDIWGVVTVREVGSRKDGSDH
jgi:hypothetical protein